MTTDRFRAFVFLSRALSVVWSGNAVIFFRFSPLQYFGDVFSGRGFKICARSHVLVIYFYNTRRAINFPPVSILQTPLGCSTIASYSYIRSTPNQSSRRRLLPLLPLLPEARKLYSLFRSLPPHPTSSCHAHYVPRRLSEQHPANEETSKRSL